MSTILIVEDEIRIRSIYSAFLSSAGYCVIEVKDAEAANEILREKNVDLVLLDICLPDITGEELCEIMSIFYPKVKVILTSVFPLEKQTALMLGAVDCHDKAHGPNELLQKVEAALLVKSRKEALLL